MNIELLVVAKNDICGFGMARYDETRNMEVLQEIKIVKGINVIVIDQEYKDSFIDSLLEYASIDIEYIKQK